jgi:hypothetical protein
MYNESFLLQSLSMCVSGRLILVFGTKRLYVLSLVEVRLLEPEFKEPGLVLEKHAPVVVRP